MKLKIKKKDRVMIISGRDRGKIGEVLKIFPSQERILVSKINVVTKHRKATQTDPSAIQKLEAPISYAKAMLVCPKCEKPVRPRMATLQTGEKVRTCRRCGETIL
ncbi:MAG: 50S ribosomal protein L24 [Elusimicrobiota bacterium]